MMMIIHSKNTKIVQVVLSGRDHQCQNQPVKNTFFYFKLIKAFGAGVQSCNVVRGKIKLLRLQSTLVSVMGWNGRNLWYDTLGELHTINKCWLISWNIPSYQVLGWCDTKIFCESYVMWTTKPVNINGYPLWGCTFAHKAGYHTEKPCIGAQEEGFSYEKKWKEKKTTNKILQQVAK